MKSEKTGARGTSAEWPEGYRKYPRPKRQAADRTQAWPSRPWKTAGGSSPTSGPQKRGISPTRSKTGVSQSATPDPGEGHVTSAQKPVPAGKTPSETGW
ncbi:MAG: hypothetical protein J6Y80_02950 [Victivallales bacterium]|nr:hypothetical protein [Victivallales bacterium]